MARRVDSRNSKVNGVTPARENQLKSAANRLFKRLPNQQWLRIQRFDPITGNPAAVTLEGDKPE